MEGNYEEVSSKFMTLYLCTFGYFLSMLTSIALASIMILSIFANILVYMDMVSPDHMSSASDLIDSLLPLSFSVAVYFWLRFMRMNTEEVYFDYDSDQLKIANEMLDATDIGGVKEYVILGISIGKIGMTASKESKFFVPKHTHIGLMPFWIFSPPKNEVLLNIDKWCTEKK